MFTRQTWSEVIFSFLSTTVPPALKKREPKHNAGEGDRLIFHGRKSNMFKWSKEMLLPSQTEFLCIQTLYLGTKAPRVCSPPTLVDFCLLSCTILKRFVPCSYSMRKFLFYQKDFLSYAVQLSTANRGCESCSDKLIHLISLEQDSV